MTYRLLDLFSGIGGFSLGLERSGGFNTVAFCEVEPFCKKILNKHWPEVPVYGDVRKLTAERLEADGIGIDAICGGFPCQDISTAGKGAGIEGERSGLWSEYARLIGELRPRYVFVENVAALLSRGLGRVLGDLAALGYDAEWHCIPASALGAPHRRDRIWIMAHPTLVQCYGSDNNAAIRMGSEPLSEFGNNGRTSNVAHAASVRSSGSRKLDQSQRSTPFIDRKTIRLEHGRLAGFWTTESNVGRVADGVPRRVDRLKALGNAVVPQIPELLGRAVLRAEGRAA